jgi:hypothetical protein
MVYMTLELRTLWGVPEALKTKMRFFRGRHFKILPLTEAVRAEAGFAQNKKRRGCK